MAISAPAYFGSRLGPMIARQCGLGWLSDTIVYCLHHVLQVGKEMRFGCMAVFGHNRAINDHVKLSVGTGGELEILYVLAGPGQCFSCHPGSPWCVPSILAVQNLQIQFLRAGQGTPPAMEIGNRMIG